MNRWLAALALVAACRADGGTRVRIDLTSLQRHAAQTKIAVDSIEVQISAADLEGLRVEVDPAALSFEVEVPSGAARRFLVVARGDVGQGEATTYWGVHTADLPPRTVVDLVIPIFPAGDVRASVSTADETALPDGLTVTFTNVSPANGRPETVAALVEDGALSRILPTGDYAVSASFTAGGTTFELPVGVAVVVRQGIVSELTLVLYPPDIPAPSGQPAGVPPGGIAAAPGLAPAGATLESTSYTIHAGALSTAPSAILSSPSYRLRASAQPIVRSSP
jgi:hypothetical protein